jgi:hypothetical protein
MATRPSSGDDCRTLWRNVVELVQGINSLLGMTATMEGGLKGYGKLMQKGDGMLLKIQTEFVGSQVAPRSRIPTPLVIKRDPPTAAYYTADTTHGAGTWGTVKWLLDYVNWGLPQSVYNNGKAQSPNIPAGKHWVTAHYSGSDAYSEADATIFSDE